MEQENLKKKIMLLGGAVLLEIVCQLFFYKAANINYRSFLLFIVLLPIVIIAIYSYLIGRFTTTVFVQGTIVSCIGGVILNVIPYIGTYLFMNEEIITRIKDSFASVTNENLSVSVEVQGGGNIVINFLIAFIIAVIFTRIGFRRHQKKNTKHA